MLHDNRKERKTLVYFCILYAKYKIYVFYILYCICNNSQKFLVFMIWAGTGKCISTTPWWTHVGFKYKSGSLIQTLSVQKNLCNNGIITSSDFPSDPGDDKAEPPPHTCIFTPCTVYMLGLCISNQSPAIIPPCSIDREGGKKDK